MCLYNSNKYESRRAFQMHLNFKTGDTVSDKPKYSKIRSKQLIVYIVLLYTHTCTKIILSYSRKSNSS